MKKYILTLLVLLVCAAQPITAYEYFTIYFSDGTKSEAFYATDVDSICYSKLSLDSIAYDDWQVQEIYTCDSVYRYPLAQIDSLSFKDVDENKVAEDINRISGVIVPLYTQHESAAELSQHLATIKNVEGVEDVWVNGQSLYVDIRDYGTITFIYPPKIDFNYALLARAMHIKSPQSVMASNENSQSIGRICIYNHMDKDDDEGYNDARWVVKELKGMYDKLGITCDTKDYVMADFFINQMFDYDQLFIITHGWYDEKTDSHWLTTDEEILCIDGNWFSHETEFRDFLNKKALYSSNKLKIVSHPEIRNGKRCIVFYVAVSEHLIESSKHRFQNPNAIVFNAACQSMKGQNSCDNLGYAFIDKGASCYIGYTDNNTFGRLGGFEFFQGVLNGSCIQSSFNLIEDQFKKENLYEYKSISTGEAGLFRAEQNDFFYELKNQYHPEIRIIHNNPELFFLHAETMDSDRDTNTSTNEAIKIHGRMRKINSDAIQAFTDYTLRPLFDKYKYGFQYSTNSDMSQAKNKEVQGNYDSSTLYMNWEATLDNSNLQPNTTYYYRAYMNDGYSDCYGEIKQFTTKGDAEAYAVLSDSTLTFYYDNKYGEKPWWGKYKIEEKYSWSPSWSNNINKVVFDSSFAYYTPVSTAYWFYESRQLVTIENINYLNTSNVTDMSSMFRECSSLVSLDLRNFNTTHVTNMECMFMDCSSLTYLDLSNFNTANVTNMSGMFSECSSLTSLDLSNFNTANVTDMKRMFKWCSSLTSLNLSSFNTANVTNMRRMFNGCNSLTSLDFRNLVLKNKNGLELFEGLNNLKSINLSNVDTSNATDMRSMFSGCSSFTSLDVSSFNTANVTDMRGMFSGCSSLTSLDVSSFNTANVTDMRGMFRGCSSLTSLDVSSFNTANVTDMGGMFYGCSSLTSLDVSSFNTANVTDMSGMFNGCSSFTSLDVSSFNTSNVMWMGGLNGFGGMFECCSSLTSLDLSNFDTANVTDMKKMFYGCKSLTKIDFRNLVFPDYTGGLGLFIGCNNLQQINLDNANTSKAEYFEDMFNGCSSLTILDLSSFDTSNLQDITRMFYNCSSLKTIYGGNWGTNGYDTFYGCYNLVGGQGTTIEGNLSGYYHGAAAHIDGGKDNPGLFTAK